MNNVEEQFRQCLLQLYGDIEFNDYAWDVLKYVLRQRYVLSETFLREIKNVLHPLLFTELLGNQQLSLDFARELDII